MREIFINLFKVKSLVTLLMTVGLVLTLSGYFKPPQEAFALFSTAYGAIITYFFTKKEGMD